jgi:asparagine synthase (glutamine-hydrolysing)
MAGIAGIAATGRQGAVEQMLDRMSHRGPAGSRVVEAEGATLGVAWNSAEAGAERALVDAHIARDGRGTRCAEARVSRSGLRLSRDRAGVAPLYYGFSPEGVLCFASEVKALTDVVGDVHELQPGCEYDGKEWECGPRGPVELLEDSPEDIARTLRERLLTAVSESVRGGNVGSWLSGGLDSSIMAALARPQVKALHSFAAGLPGAEDLTYASEVAEFVGTDHHEMVVSLDLMLDALPDVIRALESFDALLVRSSVLNYFVARAAADYVPAVLSGEGGDELFAGYSYMKEIPAAELPGELQAAFGRLHNTALQRVDRSAAAHGILAHVPFLHHEVLDYAERIPTEFKLHDGVEKWILREAGKGSLPESVLDRPKAKFWEGSGVQDVLARHAEESVSDRDFVGERRLSNGWELRSKEELLYYRVFREHLGDMNNLNWMGRTPQN